MATSSPKTHDPVEMINGLDTLVRDLRYHVEDIAEEAAHIGDEWAGLGRAGGQREDHAAALLCRLQYRLHKLWTASETAWAARQAGPESSLSTLTPIGVEL